jgi:GTP-binding protein HflX
MGDGHRPLAAPERGALIGLVVGGERREAAEQSLEELAGLGAAAGATVVARTLQERGRPDSATFIGAGKVTSLAVLYAELDVDVVMVDAELSPAQLRQLGERLDRKVLDRTQLILDIFARRARTREGRLQVELAQLQYLLPRLTGSRSALSKLGGGIGTRGPGETKLETDRRRIRTRIQVLERKIDQVRRRRDQLRERRQKRSVPTVALVGYTNAGKTTLFNRLTAEHAVVSDALFVTLDPLVRRVQLGDRRELLLSDTVGFIDRLPHALVAAFRATLEELADADLALHVIDGAAPDRARRVNAVRRVMDEVGASDVPVIEVINKTDEMAPDDVRRLLVTQPDRVAIAARDGTGVAALVDTVVWRLALDTRRVTLTFDGADASDRRRIAKIYKVAKVVSHVTENGQVLIEADVPRRLVERLRGRAASELVPGGAQPALRTKEN